jgi:crossover junction endodeoxyribonuclease RusA
MPKMNRKAEREAWTAFVENQAAGASAPMRPTSINFTVECKPAPQGSMSGVAITRDDGSPGTIFKADNKRTHPYRNQVGFEALRARAAAGVHDVFAPAETPVRLGLTFFFSRPKSAPKSRVYPVVKPDYDKLARSTTDALTGILYADDCQVVSCEINKFYGEPERVQISTAIVKDY